MAYEVKLTASGDLVWVERFPEGPPVGVHERAPTPESSSGR